MPRLLRYPSVMSKAARIRKRIKPIAFDCFAGCGGMTEGFKQAGFKVVGAIEIDEDAAKVYKLNHPRTRMWREDIKKVAGAAILRELGLKKGELDLLGGCPPCQGFSTLRTRNGAKRIIDKQNDLIVEFERLVRLLLPKHVMLENVPKLHKNHRLRTFKAALVKAGYEVNADVLNVHDYGVPQRRRRLVLVASRVTQVMFAPKTSTKLTVLDAIGALPRAGKSGDPLHDMPENRTKGVRERIRKIPPNGGSRSALRGKLKLRCHKHSDGFKDVYGRMAWHKPAPTITTGCFNPSKGRFLHPTANRAITMREAALLQSFPTHYRFPEQLGKVKLAMMIGNALPPAFIQSLAMKFAAPERQTLDYANGGVS
jgi:DNA (cytosine-5)-methyltransferase 1